MVFLIIINSKLFYNPYFSIEMFYDKMYKKNYALKKALF